MSDKVLDFPDLGTRQWRSSMVPRVSQRLAMLGATADQIEALSQALEPVFLHWFGGGQISVKGLNPDEAVKDVNAWFSRMLFGIFLELAEARFEVLRLLNEKG